MTGADGVPFIPKSTSYIPIMTDVTAGDTTRAGRREWIGLSVLALPCMLLTMDLTVLNLAVPAYVDLSNPYIFPTGSHHWTPEGHTLVSAKIKAFLDKDDYLRSSVNKRLVTSPPCATSSTDGVRTTGCEQKVQGRTSSN